MPTNTDKQTKKTLDKVTLEQLVDSYIQQDIPLSLLTDQYNVPFPQLLLILNRTRGYDYKTNFLSNHNPNFSYEKVSPDLIEIPHEIAEEYPLTYPEVVDYFTRLENLRKIITDIRSHIEKYKEKIDEINLSLSSFNLELISRIESFLKEYDSIQDKDVPFIRNLLIKYNLEIKNLPEYNKIYEDYLNVTKNLEQLKKELYKYQNESNLYSYQREYEEIREELVEKNVKLVNWCIRRFFNNIPLPQEETQAFGLEALAIAINEFDYQKGFHFSSYAVPIIVNHIKKHFKELYGMDFRDYVAKESIRYNRQLMRQADPKRYQNPTPTEISELGLIGMSPQRITNYDNMLDSIIPFSDAYHSLEIEEEHIPTINDMPTTFSDYEIINEYEDKTSIGADIDLLEEYVKKLTREEIKIIISRLTEREQRILNLRFGLSGEEPLTYEQIGKMLNISRGYVREIEARALRRLRHPRNTKNLKDYYVGSPMYYGSHNSKEKRYNGDQIYLKLIELLKYDFTYNGVLTFMNMEGLNWQSEDLNNNLYLLYKMCELIKMSMSEDEEEIKDKYFQYHLKEIFSTYKMPLSEYFISYLVENYDKVLSLITLFEIKHDIKIKNSKIDENIEFKRRFL